MKYTVKLTEKAQKELSKMNKSVAAQIAAWIDKNLSGCEDPRAHGKALVGKHSGEWRYRVGDYRILAVIRDDIVIIEIFKIGHRREIYNK